MRRPRMSRLVLPLLLGALAAVAPASALTVTEFPTLPEPGALPHGIATGDAGSLFVAAESDFVYKIGLSGGIASSAPASGTPTGIAAGPDGNMWFTKFGANAIGRVSTASFGFLADIALPVAASQPFQIVKGPDGNLWFTEFAHSVIARVTPGGSVNEVATTAPTRGITVGPDGNIWFTENANVVGRIDPGTNHVTEFPVTGGTPRKSIVAGPDGNLWFTANAPNATLGRVSTSGSVHVFPSSVSDINAAGLAVGRDGYLWFTEFNDSRLARMSTSGTVKEFPLSITPNSSPLDITRGPDGKLWFTEFNGHRIANLRFDPAVAVTGSNTGVTSTKASLLGTVNPQDYPTTYWFQFGPSTAYGKTTAAAGAGNGDIPLAISSSLTGLSPRTTYHYRLGASNVLGTVFGPDATFTTKKVPLHDIASTVTHNWSVRAGLTRVVTLTVNSLEAHAKVLVKCKASRHGVCPFKSKTLKNTRKKKHLKLAGRFRGHLLPPGARITITISAPNAVPKTVTFTTRATKTPKVRSTCKPSGHKARSCHS